MRMARAVRPQSMSLSAVIALARDSSLKAGGHRVLEVEEHQIRAAAGAFLEHVVVARGHREFGTPEQISHR